MAGFVTALQAVIIVSVALLSAVVYVQRDVQQKTARSIDILLGNSGAPREIDSERQQAIYDELPPVVRSYFQKAFPKYIKNDAQVDWESIKRIKSLNLTQSGTFRMNDEWVPFTANQFMSGALDNIGFLWQATIMLPVPSILPPYRMDLPVHVQDVYVQGQGRLDARLLGIVPVAHFEDNPAVNSGELLRWLAETVLVPTCLLPDERNIITWKAVSDDTAELQVRDMHSGTNGTLSVKFNDDGFPVSFYGIRAKAVGEKFVYDKWEGRLHDFKLHDGIMVPTKMDAGWWESDREFRLYFRGENTAFEFDYF